MEIRSMTVRIPLPAAVLLVLSGCGSPVDRSLFTVETVDGARIVHNHAPQLGSRAGARLEPVGRIGRLESRDDRELLYDPVVAIRLPDGDILILERNGCRVRRYSAEHEWKSEFGQKGQGPGDFSSPYALGLSPDRRVLYVAERSRISRFSPDGAFQGSFKPSGLGFGSGSIGQQYQTAGIAVLSKGRVVLPHGPAEDGAEETGLLAVHDDNGRILRTFGDIRRFDDLNLTLNANIALLTADADDNVYVAYAHQNRIDRYSPDGQLVFSADRRLPYAVRIGMKTEVFSSGDIQQEFQWPSVTSVSKGVGVDSENRIWVLTFLREPDRFGRFEGHADMSECYVFDVFDAAGIHLFKVPCPNVELDAVSISGDRLFLIDNSTESCVYEYRIVETGAR